MMLVTSIAGFAQSGESEKAKPMTGAEIVRKCSTFDIEGHVYEDVVIKIKSNDPDMLFTYKSKVKVSATNTSGISVWSKTFKNAYLYVYSTGQIQVGRPNFNQLVIQKSHFSETWIGMVREKEGIY